MMPTPEDIAVAQIAVQIAATLVATSGGDVEFSAAHFVTDARALLAEATRQRLASAPEAAP